MAIYHHHPPHYDSRYSDIATMTVANKREYCRQLGYPLVVRSGTVLEVDGRNVSLHSALDEKQGLVKCGLFWEMLRRFPNCSWIFHGDTDAVSARCTGHSSFYHIYRAV